MDASQLLWTHPLARIQNLQSHYVTLIIQFSSYSLFDVNAISGCCLP